MDCFCASVTHALCGVRTHLAVLSACPQGLTVLTRVFLRYKPLTVSQQFNLPYREKPVKHEFCVVVKSLPSPMDFLGICFSWRMWSALFDHGVDILFQAIFDLD